MRQTGDVKGITKLLNGKICHPYKLVSWGSDANRIDPDLNAWDTGAAPNYVSTETKFDSSDSIRTQEQLKGTLCHVAKDKKMENSYLINNVNNLSLLVSTISFQTLRNRWSKCNNNQCILNVTSVTFIQFNQDMPSFSRWINLIK